MYVVECSEYLPHNICSRSIYRCYIWKRMMKLAHSILLMYTCEKKLDNKWWLRKNIFLFCSLGMLAEIK